MTYVSHAQPTATSVDLSQSIGRHRVSYSDSVFRTVTPGERRWMFSHQRLRTACESLGLQAIPWQDLELGGTEVPTMHSLAGNAWTGTVAMAVIV